jgi:GTP-binding protein EngB required for normal cell division
MLRLPELITWYARRTFSGAPALFLVMPAHKFRIPNSPQSEGACAGMPFQKPLGSTSKVDPRFLHLSDLNLIDLPGMTAVAIKDQPEDIDQHIQDLIVQYANFEESIMLVVMPAADDIQNHRSLSLAKKLDPHGNRTLAVITKCDKETPRVLYERLTENVAQLKFGYALLR